MSDDFYLQAARARAGQLDAELAAAKADLAAYRSQADYDSAAVSVQQIANLTAEQRNLHNLCDQYVRSQQPPARPELTAEERAARPVTKMDWSDVVDLARGSRYGKNIKADDPNLIAGWNEARRRSGRGE
jgi:DNA-binding transcriptional regulator YbjK